MKGKKKTEKTSALCAEADRKFQAVINKAAKSIKELKKEIKYLKGNSQHSKVIINRE